ncbi:Mtch-1p [Parelaphostrongylus tenuis]|uniref:Mtch-1p n=1 Tax=Parelaphostrongylus tenuis TaxID=148309 RepID=A0AAD5NDP1_PARTN|nr:Mtch-1p [Parelaphostrongylus tenuis]
MGRRGERRSAAGNRGGGGAGGLGGISNQRNSLAIKADALIGDQLLPGRHPCKCQARIHALVRNCMGCGKIVCAQEGSGPCFFCGTLVCTKEGARGAGEGD